jgi:multidrug resistance protein MdtO
MASRSETLPAADPSRVIDQAGQWFWGFLKNELAPYPGRAWVVARITIAATIVMIIVMTFRIPNGFLAAIFTLFLSRENPTATLRSGFRAALAFTIATAYTLLGVTLLVADPLTHFLWIVLSLFIAFYLIGIISDYGTAVGFGFLLAGAIPLWDQTLLNVNDRVENTLWLGFTTPLGVTVAVVVEYVFRRVHPTTDLTEGIEHRLQAVENVLRGIAAQGPLGGKLEKEISLYTGAGMSRLRRLLNRSGFSSHFISQMNAAVSLLGRLVDLAASLHHFRAGQSTPLSAEDQERCQRLADEISILREDLGLRKPPRPISLPHGGQPSNLPFLPAMETTAALIPQAFVGAESINEFIPAPMDDEVKQPFFAPDAFSNPDHLKFAIRGMLAATASYVVYTAVDWRGLSTSIPTCIITALSTIGSSRQKQFLRLGGAIIGGIVVGMGAQVFVLPYLDSIAGFTLLFAGVTALSAWIATASPRLSYLGVQLALAFYLINLQEFAIQTSLSIARDRIFGVFLGLLCMWLIFDRLWVKDALEEMQTVFARNLDMFAELAVQMLKEDRNESVKRVRRLRDQINAGFQAVTAQGDAVLFELGPSRPRKLQVREDFKRWQPSLRTLLLVQLTAAQYRLQMPLNELPEAIAKAHVAFEKDTARVMQALAGEVRGKTSEAVPDIQASAANLGQEIRKSYEERGLPVAPQTSDMISLTENVASILAPLYKDIHATFATPQEARGGLQQYRPGEA